MAELRESSGLTSLAALRRHELERSQKQAEEARTQAEAEQRARLAAERARSHAAEQRTEHERGLVQSIQAGRRAELAELEAARALEFERAERAARAHRDLELCLAEERTKHRRTEVLLLARVSRARLVGALSWALCLATWLGTIAVYLGIVRAQTERSRAALDSALLDVRRARSDAEASSKRANQRESMLADRAATLERTLQAERAVTSEAPLHAVGRLERPGAHVVRPAIQQVPCQENGDPLDPCLGRAPRRSPP